MSPLKDITNRKRKFSPSIELHSDYRTLRSILGLSGTTAIDENVKIEMRSAKKKCLDLWVDGELYPLDPQTRMAIPCSDLASFMRYIGDGENGLLGYCKRLEAHGRLVLPYYQHQIESHFRLKVDELMSVNNSLQIEISSLKQQLEKVHEEIEYQKLELQVAHKKEMDDMVLKLNKSTYTNKQICQKLIKQKRYINSLKRSNGIRQRRRVHQPVETLATTGGAIKKRIKASRCL